MNSTTSTLTNKCENKIFSSPTSLPFIFGLFANICSTTVVTAVSKKHKVPLTIKLISYNDFLNCFLYVFYIIFNTFTCDNYGHSDFCNVGGMLALTSLFWSIHLVCLMSVERAIMVTSPIFHRTFCSGKNMYIIMAAAILYITDILYSSLPLFGFAEPYVYYNNNRLCTIVLTASKTNTQQNAYILYFGINHVISSFITVTSNILIACRLKKNKVTDIKKEKKEKKNQISLLTKVIALVNCILNLPFGVNFPYLNFN